MKIYVREIGQTETLTRSQEVELSRRAKAGDEIARQMLIRAHLRLVVHIAREYARQGLPLLDLVSEGTVGLSRAVDEFEPESGALSETAPGLIRQAMNRAMASQGRRIRLPIHMMPRVAHLQEVRRELRRKSGREPTNEELAGRLNISVSAVSEWRALSLEQGGRSVHTNDAYVPRMAY